MSIVQQTEQVGAVDQMSRLRGSVATLRRSTTVMPRVRSLMVSTSTQWREEWAEKAGSRAIDIAMGSGSEMPISPDCAWLAFIATALHSMAKRARGVLKARTWSMSAG